MSLFFGINIALKGMMAQQTSISVTSHNIANANTDGYSRQRVNLQTSIPISGIAQGTGQMGSGVEIAEIFRLKDDFLNYQVRKETSARENWNAVSNTLQKIETVFMEPSATGFNEVLNQFWSDWQELSKFAESSPIRTSLKESAVSLTDSLRQMSAKLTEIRNDAQTQINLKIPEINSIAGSIDHLNEQIVGVKLTGQNPNDLLDQRDQALEQLAALANITVTDLQDVNGKYTGAIEVKLGTLTIVDSSGAKTISSTDVNSSSVQGGELAGLLKVGGTADSTDAVQHYIDKLDTLAVGIAKAVNEIHATGKALDGTLGQDFFVFKDASNNLIDLTTVDWDNPFANGLSAANIFVNPDIEGDVSKIAAAEGTGTFLEGNGTTALQIAQLRNTYFEYDSVNKVLQDLSTGQITLGMFYSDMIAELGSSSREAQRMVINQEALVEQSQTRRESIRGVSLDEEMANMVLYQHAFDSSARVISVMDEMLNTIVNELKR